MVEEKAKQETSCGEEKILDPTGTRTPTRRSSSLYPVAIPTALSRLPTDAETYFIIFPQCSTAGLWNICSHKSRRTVFGSQGSHTNVVYEEQLTRLRTRLWRADHETAQHGSG
jgi:hypothetical protein